MKTLILLSLIATALRVPPEPTYTTEYQDRAGRQLFGVDDQGKIHVHNGVTREDLAQHFIETLNSIDQDRHEDEIRLQECHKSLELLGRRSPL